MKYYAFILVLLMLPLAAAQAPFVQDGRIVATIVVGESAPATDVILGAEVASYLQRFATEVTFGLAVTSADISLSHNAPLILIGTPENNPLVADQLGVFSNNALSGPVIELSGDRLVLSGPTDAHVRAATQWFIQGRTSTPDQPVRTQPVTSPPRTPAPEPVVEPEPQAPPAFVGELPQEAAPECEPVRYCRGADIIVSNAECDEVVLTTCSGLCRDGECVFIESRPTAWQRFVSALAFWRR